MNCYRKWMHRNQTLNCNGCWEIVFKAPNLCICYQHLGQQSSQIHLCSPWRLLAAWRGRKWTRLSAPISGVLHCWGCWPAENAGNQFTKGCTTTELLQWDKSSMQKHTERNIIRKQFLVATGLLNQFSYPTMYRQCQSKSNKNPKLSMISNKQTKNK